MLPTEDAEVVAAELARRFGAPRWSFTLSATDANRWALRLCRAITGRPRVLVNSYCYHGTVDESLIVVGSTGRGVVRDGNVGAPGDVTLTSRVVEFNDLPGLRRELAHRDVAAVLMEPAMTNVGIVLPDPGYLDGVRDLTRSAGALLVNDETHTFSAGPGGCTLAWSLEPDIVTIGKAIGGGIPIGAYGLSAETAERVDALPDVDLVDTGGIGGTLAGNALSLAAAKATLSDVLTDAAFAGMTDLATRYTAGVERIIERNALAVVDQPARGEVRVPLRVPGPAQRDRVPPSGRSGARGLPPRVPRQPRHPAHPVPQHGADVPGYDGRRRGPASRRARGRGRSAARVTGGGSPVSRNQRAVEHRRAVHAALLAGGLRWPEGLPVVERHDDLAAAIGEHQVVIVAGETGSGKSTQLPKLCLELGRGVDGLIGHTQPRRVAARTIAARVAEELGTTVGGAVGYSVRFDDRVGDDTLIRVMTDGVLLAELHRDRMLRRYDTLIVDEAHERSLNVDFLLGYVRRLLPQRPDLKVVVTSATIDTDRFASHFAVEGRDAPVVEVTGRTYPVEVRYRPFGIEPEDDRDQVQAIVEAVDELAREGPGDVLVFLSGEREIHDTADALRRRNDSGLDVLPLYARLSSAEQHRIFEPHRVRRVVLSTNVAETSLTVPGVRYVVDAGTARISRFSRRLKVQRLPIEAVSQASANQRAGRCGRVAPGICIRLYGEDDFAARPAFTEPEILRTNLGAVILQMLDIGLGDVAAFPFVEAPDTATIRDGHLLLDELGAITGAADGGDRRLTAIGKRLARLPVDPRLGRMVLEAERHGCVREVLVIAAALSMQDPRAAAGRATASR